MSEGWSKSADSFFNWGQIYKFSRCPQIKNGPLMGTISPNLFPLCLAKFFLEFVDLLLRFLLS
jgi:hypothetical protein